MKAAVALQIGALLAWTRLLAPAPAAAEQGLELGASELVSDELLFEDIPSVYGASKHEQRVTDAPAAVSVITAAEIRSYGYRSMAEILRSVRGFYVTDDQTYMHIGVRGFGQLGDWNTRVLLLIDGERVSDNIYDLSPIGHDFPLDVDIIERIEIIRGPSSSVHGGNAMFGVINVITRRGRDVRGVEVAAGALAPSTAQGRVTWGEKLQSGVELLVSASLNQNQGELLYLPELDTPETGDGLTDGLNWKHSYQALVTASYRGFTAQLMHSDAATGLSTGIWGTVYDAQGGYSRDISSRLALKWVLPMSGVWSGQVQTQLMRYQLRGAYPMLWQEPGSPDEIYLNYDRADGDALRSEVQLNVLPLPWVRLVMGAQHQLNMRQMQQNYELEGDEAFYYLDDLRSGHVIGLFTQGEVELSPKVMLNAGLRYDWYSTFGGTFNPRLAAIVAPNDATNFKLLYGQAFRSPNAYEMYYNDSERLHANLGLEPEQLRSVEFLWEQRLSGGLRVSAGAFNYWLSDLIAQAEDSTGGLAYQNLEAARAVGGEAEVEGRLVAGVTGRFSYTYSHAVDAATGLTLSNAPEHLVKLNLQRGLWRDRLGVGLEGQLISERGSWDGTAVPAYPLINATIVSQQLVPGLDLSVGVYNLLNQAYSHPVSAEHVMGAISQDGARVRVRATYAF